MSSNIANDSENRRRKRTEISGGASWFRTTSRARLKMEAARFNFPSVTYSWARSREEIIYSRSSSERDNQFLIQRPSPSFVIPKCCCARILAISSTWTFARIRRCALEVSKSDRYGIWGESRTLVNPLKLSNKVGEIVAGLPSVGSSFLCLCRLLLIRTTINSS